MTSGVRGVFVRSCLMAASVTALLVGGGAWLAARPIVGPLPERMRTGAYEFELASGWQCVREGTEHVCRKGSNSKAAIAIMTMKERGPADTSAAYLQHLATPQRHQGQDGKDRVSQVIHVRQERLAGRDWIIGRHYESEVPGYTTDYYAALTSHKAILITFSVHHSQADEFAPDLAHMVQSLKVFQE